MADSQTSSRKSPSKSSSVLDHIGPRGIAAIVLAILVIIFIAENTRHVKMRFIAGPEVSAPIWLALLIAALVGALAGLLIQRRRSR